MGKISIAVIDENDVPQYQTETLEKSEALEDIKEYLGETKVKLKDILPLFSRLMIEVGPQGVGYSENGKFFEEPGGDRKEYMKYLDYNVKYIFFFNNTMWCKLEEGEDDG